MTAAEIKALAAALAPALAPLVAQELQKMTAQSDAQLEMQHFMSRPREERKKIQQQKMRKATADLKSKGLLK